MPRPAPPPWTDFNDSDPGITALQLFAYLGIAVLFSVGVVVAVRRRCVSGRRGAG